MRARVNAVFDFLSHLLVVAVPYYKSPQLLFPYKPDWHAAEVLAPREVDYYPSHRALGQLYREVSLKPLPARVKEESLEPDDDNITLALRPKVSGAISDLREVEQADESEIFRIFEQYQDELTYICLTHVTTNQPGAKLSEEEIVTGTIVAKVGVSQPSQVLRLIEFSQSTEPKWRNERIFRMQLNSTALAHETRRRITKGWKRTETVGAIDAMKRAWRAWIFSVRNRMQFAANTFGLIALAVIFDVLNDFASSESAEQTAEETTE